VRHWENRNCEEDGAMKMIPAVMCGINLAFLAMSGAAQAAPKEKPAPCEGNACGDVQIWYDGCYQAINHGAKQVVLILGEWQKILSPGERFTLKDVPNYKSCPQSFNGIAKANY
jgi:hypothetical protein